jgi:hypothetical protein
VLHGRFALAMTVDEPAAGARAAVLPFPIGRARAGDLNLATPSGRLLTEVSAMVAKFEAKLVRSNSPFARRRRGTSALSLSRKKRSGTWWRLDMPVQVQQA